MKLLKMGDLHIGVKQDDSWMQNVQRLLIKQAIEYSKQHGITRWLQSGDFFDVRKAITHKTMELTREIATDLKEAGISVDVIIGNHDMAMKQKIHPNSCNELLSQFDNFTIYDKITTVNYDGIDIDLVPWICDENKEEIIDFITKTKSRYCLGHFELVGFYFYKGMKSNGEDPAFLRKYKHVWSGHFHTISKNRNVTFLGTPYSITSGDENDERGFWVFDTETEESEFIQNDVMWHRKVYYPTTVNPKMFKDLAVRVFVDEIDKDFAKFETDMEAVCHSLKVVMKSHQVEDTDGDPQDIDTSVSSISDIMADYVDRIEDQSKESLDATKIIVNELYMECLK